MLYIGKSSDFQAARKLVAYWQAEHDGYYGTSCGRKCVAYKHWPDHLVGLRELVFATWPDKHLGRPAPETGGDGTKIRLGYTTDGADRHQWVRSSLTMVQLDFAPDHVVLRLAGRRHSLAEMGRQSDALAAVFASAFETLVYQTTQPSWGPFDTADGPWRPA